MENNKKRGHFAPLTGRQNQYVSSKQLRALIDLIWRHCLKFNLAFYFTDKFLNSILLNLIDTRF